MMRTILVLYVILIVSLLARLPVPGLAEPNPPDVDGIINIFEYMQQANGTTTSSNSNLDYANELLKNMSSQSEEMLNQSQKEYMVAKNESGINSSDLDDFEAMISGIEQLINFLTDLIDSTVTIIDSITSFTEK